MDFKTIKKRFFSSAKECDWLCELGQKGYLLVAKTENAYTFELTQRALYYSVEWLDQSPECEESLDYFKSRKENGVELATTYSLWAYFVSAKPIETSDEAKQRIAIRYRNTAFWLCLADLVTAVLIGYHLSIRPFLESNSVVPESPVLETSSNHFMQLLYRLWFGAEKIFYFYTDLCTGIFGNTKAAFTLGILIPLAIVLSVLSALWIREWRRNAPPKNKNTEEDMQNVCQEPEASGKAEDNL